jgi:hypothetical protein
MPLSSSGEWSCRRCTPTPQAAARRLDNRLLAVRRNVTAEDVTESDQEEPFEWDSFTTANGLPHNWIYDIFQDSSGRMWVGTWGGGLARYADDHWTVFTTRHGWPAMP